MVQKYLRGAEYPATKEDLIDHARYQGADEEIISLLEDMTEDEFANPAEVNRALEDEYGGYW